LKQILSTNEQKIITDAVSEAEKQTSGEITVAIIRESSDYMAQEFLFAFLGGMITSLIMLLFSNQIEQMLIEKLWGYSSGYLILFYIATQFAVVLILYLLANTPFVDRMIVNHKTMIQKVNQRATRHFLESGTHMTKDNTGILIFISLLEKRVELLADHGISNKIDKEKWQNIVDNITEGIKKNQLVDNLVDSIAQCGELLNQHFPANYEKANELDNRPTILEE